jgi:zinc transport system substrate-binding protein
MCSRPRLRGRSSRPPALLVASALACGFALAGCGGDSPAADGKLDVVVGFYPLQYAVEQVGGPHVSVRNLTRAGAEPHDLELTPREVGQVSRAGLVVYLKGFQPGVDDAVRSEGGDRGLDVSTAARLEGSAPAEEGEASPGGPDPHFWLDPTRLADVGDAIAGALAAADPANAADYDRGAATLRTGLEALDTELREGLAGCTNRQLVTSHQAFGYLARRYGLRQTGIAGISPEQEPDAAALAKVADLVRREKVRTVYSEALVSPKIAQTVAAETGARTAVLDPIEGLSSESAGRDYGAVMRADLATLREGQPCP